MYICRQKKMLTKYLALTFITGGGHPFVTPKSSVTVANSFHQNQTRVESIPTSIITNLATTMIMIITKFTCDFASSPDTDTIQESHRSYPTCKPPGSRSASSAAVLSNRLDPFPPPPQPPRPERPPPPQMKPGPPRVMPFVFPCPPLAHPL